MSFISRSSKTSSSLLRVVTPRLSCRDNCLAYTRTVSTSSESQPLLGPNVGVNQLNKPDPSQQQHVFQPVASQSLLSPMRRTTTWLTALRAREKKRAAWIEENKDDLASGKLTLQDLPEDSYSYSSVGTTDVDNRSPADSFSYVILPFKNNEWFLDAYINAYGKLRIGQVFQDLDSIACVIAYRHCYPAQPVIVTASVDRIYMKKRLEAIDNFNVSLSGNVTWSGRTSMEITIKAATHKEDLTVDSVLTPEDVKEENVFLTANFTFVARNPETERSFAVNKLVPETKSEQLDFMRAEKYNAHKRLDAAKNALTSVPPSEEESRIIHNMWLGKLPNTSANGEASSTQLQPPASQVAVTLMHDSRISSTALMQPQSRNIHSYMIFGGYLLRQTFELAYSCAAAFSQDIPRFVSLDSTTFRNPVPVGSVLYLNATVVYTEFINGTMNPGTKDEINNNGSTPNTSSKPDVSAVPGTLIQVRVDSSVNDLTHGGTTTNTGQFTFSYFVAASPKTAPPGTPPKYFSILPQTYAEMMQYLEGRRKAIESANFNTYVRLMPNPKEIVSE